MSLGLFRRYAPAGDPPASAVTALGRGATLAAEEYRRQQDARQYDAVTALRTGSAVKGYDAAVSEAEARRVLILAAARIAAAAAPGSSPGAPAPTPSPGTAAATLPFVSAPTGSPIVPQSPSSSSAGWIALGLFGAASLAGLAVWKVSGS